MSPGENTKDQTLFLNPFSSIREKFEKKKIMLSDTFTCMEFPLISSRLNLFFSGNLKLKANHPSHEKGQEINTIDFNLNICELLLLIGVGESTQGWISTTSRQYFFSTTGMDQSYASELPSRHNRWPPSSAKQQTTT